MDLSCKRCGKDWTYSGGRKFYATCPDCKTSVRIPDKTIRKATKTSDKKAVKDVEKRMVEQEKMLGEKLEKFGSMTTFFEK